MSNPTNLSKLNLVPLKRRARLTVQEQRREKIRIKIAGTASSCRSPGRGQTVRRTGQAKWTRDENGQKVRIQREKIVRPWWFSAEGGQGLMLVVKYGSRAIELAKGKQGYSRRARPDAARSP